MMNNVNNKTKFLALFFFCVSIIIFIIRLPILYNADLFLNSDEAFDALTFLDMIEMGKILFYHEGVTYSGVLEIVAAIPLILTMGFNALPLKITATIFYLLVVITSYFLAKHIFGHRVGIITVILLTFCSPFLTYLSTFFFPHLLILFLGNLILIYYLQLSKNQFDDRRKIVTLGFLMGLSIYGFMMVILHIATIAVMFLKNHSPSLDLKGKFIGAFDSNNKRQLFLSLLDLAIIGFGATIVFSIVFGGFSIDIATWSIIQIHDVRNPIIQVFVIILVRLWFGKDAISLMKYFSNFFHSNIKSMDKRFYYLAIGFLIGFLPRLYSILSGDAVKGGHFLRPNIDLQVLNNFVQYFSNVIPQGLGLNVQLFPAEIVSVDGFLYFFVACFFVFAVSSYTISRKHLLKELFSMKKIEFNPEHCILIFSIILSVAIVFNSREPLARHIGGLLVFFAIISAFYLEKLRTRSLLGFIAIVFFISSWNLSNTYRFYKSQGIVSGYEITKRKDQLFGVIYFMKEKGIKYGYANYWIAHRISFFEKNTILVAENIERPRGARVQAKLKDVEKFAVIVKSSPLLKKYYEILDRTNIGYQEKIIGEYHVLYDFLGDKEKIFLLKKV